MDHIKSEIQMLCDDLRDFVSIEKLEDTEVMKRIEGEVVELLHIEKPKIMVYGIYNAGKSTLINSILEKEVAVVRDCPTTYKIDEFDAGSYVLVDSPGVDAPADHEKVTNAYLSKCHVILYVVSTKGGFESIRNYQNMYELIRIGKPFIIVINDKEGDVNLSTSQNIHQIKCKIIDNLRKVSGNAYIDQQFDSIAVNGKRAFDGIIKGKPKLYEMSNIELLKQKILYFLDSSKAMRIFAAPVHNMIRIIDDLLEKVQKESIAFQNQQYQMQLKGLNQKRMAFISQIPYEVDSIANRYINTLIQAACNENSDQWKQLYGSIFCDIDGYCKRQEAILATYLKTEFMQII